MAIFKRALLITLSAFVAVGCFGDDPLTTPVDASQDGAAEVGPSDAGDASVEAETSAPLPNACTANTECGSKRCFSGVCVADPPEGLEGQVTDTDNISTGDAPNLLCVDSAPATPAGPASVTLYGAVARFGNGQKTVAIQVDIFAADTFDPSICESEPTPAKQLECYQNYGTNGFGVAPLGTAVSTPVPEAQGLPASCKKLLGDEADHALCPMGYRCIEDDLDWLCKEQYGVYQVDNIPTNTPLVIRSRATEYKEKWHDSYTFNVYLFADKVEAGDRYHYDATMVSEGQWQLTPNTVGLPAVPPENGAIGGRVRDCRTDARDSWPISGVSLDLANPAQKIVFFNNLEDDTVPLPDADASNILGRFAALDIPAGWNRIGGSVRIGSEVFGLGGVDVYVFPDSLSLVTFPGLQPHWSQKPSE